MAEHVGVRAGLDGVSHPRGFSPQRARVERVAFASEHRVDADPERRLLRQRRRNRQGVELGELRGDRQRRLFVLQIPLG